MALTSVGNIEIQAAFDGGCEASDYTYLWTYRETDLSTVEYYNKTVYTGESLCNPYNDTSDVTTQQPSNQQMCNITSQVEMWRLDNTNNYMNLPQQYHGDGSSNVLVLPSDFLGAGEYEIKVQIPYTDFESSMFILLDEPELVAKIAGGSSQTVSHGDVATIDAYWLSYDPNNPRDASYLTFSWSCMEDDDINSINETTTDPVTGHFLSNCSLLTGINHNDLGVLVIDTSVLQLRSYVFRVKVQRDSRYAFADQVLSIVSGYVPKIRIL